MFSRSRLLLNAGIIAVALAGTSALLADFADARSGGGRSFGSRGGRTFATPPTTNTAPKPAAPMEKSMTQPGQPGTAASSSLPAAGAAAAQTSRFSSFGGWRGLLMGGLIGAGLASLFGMGAFANVLGFLLQAALIAGIVYFVLAYFRNRRAQPALAGAPVGTARPRESYNYRPTTGGLGGGNSNAALNLKPQDFEQFEKLLGEVQVAYGRGDLDALGQRLTPEMLSYFAEELDGNAKKGVRNEVSQPKLLKGDLSEAWSEANDDYATVAMRYALIDTTVDIASGRVVSGDRSKPQEVTEMWTFRRPRSGTTAQWELSAIQQAA